MRRYYVIWTYMGNYSDLMQVDAESADKAKEYATGFYGKEFQDNASVFVFDAHPALIQHKGKEILSFPEYAHARRGSR